MTLPRSVRPHLHHASSGRTALRRSALTADITPCHNGSPGDVLLQGFHRASCDSREPSWYAILAENADVLKGAGFDMVWMPPPSASVDNLGYLPTRWLAFDTSYGTAAELDAALTSLAPIRCVADIVVNHRCGAATGGADFEDPPFPIADQTAAICSDDDSGIGTGAPDTGDRYPDARDLDHTNPGVRTAVVDYLAVLARIGFQGWRFDYTKGYAAEAIGIYNAASAPYFAVGEYWDSDRQAVVNFIDGTSGQCTAFDFPTRTLLQAALAGRELNLLSTIDGKPTGTIGWWPAMSVTFLENHDTEGSDPFGDADAVVQGYAYLLTHPGIPCVFWSHFFDKGSDVRARIATLLEVRKTQGLHRESVVNIQAARADLYAAIIDDKVAMKLGPAPWQPDDDWSLATAGNDYAVWVR